VSQAVNEAAATTQNTTATVRRLGDTAILFGWLLRRRAS
jgi:hypothetical protein